MGPWDLSDENTSFRETTVDCLSDNTLYGNLFESCSSVKIDFLLYLKSSSTNEFGPE